MLDVSGSMSFPSTPAEQARLMAVNPDNLGEISATAASSHAILPRKTLAPVESRIDPGRRPIVQWQYEPIPRRILPRLYHFALGNDADIFYKRHNQYDQRQQCKLDQYAGYKLLYRRNHVLHSIARRCRRLCGERSYCRPPHTESQ